MASPELPSHFRKARPYVREARDRLLAQFWSNPNVVGAGFGRRTVDGTRTDTPACVVYVATKIPQDELPRDEILPRSIVVHGERIDVDVRQTGHFYAQEYTDRERPAPSGISVGHRDVTAGTLGCLVTDTFSDNRLSILSNNHVLANSNQAKVGDPVLQPGAHDDGTEPHDVIGRLARWVDLDPAGENIVDCAIAHVSNPGDVIDQMKGGRMTPPTRGQPAVGLLFAGGCSGTLINPIREVVRRLGVLMARTLAEGPFQLTDPVIDQPIQKTGRTTEYTTGIVADIDARARVQYDIGVLSFTNQILTSADMSAGGDSGSVVCVGGPGETARLDTTWGVLEAAERSTGIPVTQEQAAVRNARDRYLRHTLVGQWALDTFYVNQATILERLGADKVQKPDRRLAQALYAKYSADAKLALADPDRDDLRVSSQLLHDMEAGLRAFEKYFTQEEGIAARELLDLARSARGKNAREVLSFLDEPDVYRRARGIVARVSSLHDPYR